MTVEIKKDPPKERLINLGREPEKPAEPEAPAPEVAPVASPEEPPAPKPKKVKPETESV